VLRLCILNHSTSQAEVDRALELAATLPVDVSAGPPAVARESSPPIEAGWLRRSPLDPDTLRSLPVFESLSREQAVRILLTAHEHHAATGEVVIEQWQISRELYVVLSGAVEVAADGSVLRTLGPREFFGELAAIDWGAGFARTRSATVTAKEPTRLLVLDWQLVDWLMRVNATFGEMLERVSRERLAAS
jgi:signal-transduction protein with cAMP-binding, CBS, and nucleotidyltransferase domain